MAFRTWARLLGATLGVGALAGASQLGLAYGLGILRLTRVVSVTTRDQWTAQLAWVAWYAMIAAVIGALVGRTLIGAARHGPVTRITLALAAGAGAAVVVPLTMQPARTAQVAGVHPVFVIGICAGLGALAGVIAAYATVTSTVARWGLIAFGAAVWVIAIASVAPSLAPDGPLPAVRLGVFDAGYLTPSATQRTALFTMPVLALVGGAILGWAARRREMPTLTIALAGLPGPALLTVAYLIAGPGSGQDRYQVVPYWAAMTAAGAGVLGSVLVAVLRRDPTADELIGEKATPERPEADEPTPGRPPLPRRDVQTESAIAQAAAAQRPEEQLRTPDTAVFTRPAPPAPVQTMARPEPQMISAPVPNPTPSPRARGKKDRDDGEFVDWVNGLGSDKPK